MILTQIIFSLLLTIIIEVPLLFLHLKNYKKVTTIFILINIITNLTLNVLNLFMISFSFNSWFNFILISEMTIPFIEYYLLKKVYNKLKENSYIILYSINFASFLIGGTLLKIVF